MPGPFRFLDRIDALVSGPASVATTVRDAVLPPNGYRLVTKAGDASRIPAADVAAHVREVALDVLRVRVRPGLADALREHLDEVRAEHELTEGPCPDDAEGSFRRDQWCVNLENAATASFRDGDLSDILTDFAADAIAYDQPEMIADAVLAAPIVDADAVLARVGVTAAVVDEIVAAIRVPPPPTITIADGTTVEPRPGGQAEVRDWSVRALGCYAQMRQQNGDTLIEEGVTYVLTDPDTIATGAELLGLEGDEGFLTWARERAAFSDPAQDAADVAEVLRLAGAGPDDANAKGGDALATPETAAGVESATTPAAQPQKSVRPEPAEASDLTRAAGAALAVLYDHGCETDKAMAEALGVQKAVVNQSRHGKSPFAPDERQRDVLLGLVTHHLAALEAARDGLLTASV